MILPQHPADIYPSTLCRLFRAIAGLSIALVPATSAMAMSYVPMTDEALLASADVVVIGKVVEAGGAAGRQADEASYKILPDEVLKGAPGSDVLEVRLPGAYDQSIDGALIIPGMPRLAPDEPVLLFLNQHSDGSFSPSQLLLGVFRVREDSKGESVLAQDLEQAEEIRLPGHQPGNRRFRNTRRFADWVRNRARGNPHVDPYWTEGEVAPRGKYQLSSPPARWFEFQDNQDLSIYANGNGTTALDTESLQAAINAFNAAPGSVVSLQYGGLSTQSSGLARSDGVTQVLFNDPNDELSGIFDCLIGGIGAYGRWRSHSVREFNGATYGIIYEGDIVVQDGLSCLFVGDRKVNAAELLAHEIGHVLGLGHSCGDGALAACVPGTTEDDALMRPTLHADGRGASLGSDDIAGLSKLYPAVDDGGATPTVPDQSADPEPAAAAGGGIDSISLWVLMFAFIGMLAREPLRSRKLAHLRLQGLAAAPEGFER